MKKNLLLACLFLGASQMCFGQFTKGQKVLGGTVSLSYGQSKDTAANSYQGNNYSFGINPSFGKFKDEKTLAEFNLSIGFGRNKSSSQTNTSTNKNFSVGVGYTVTKLYPIVNKVYFTLGYGISAGYNRLSNENSSTQGKTEQQTYSAAFGVTPGILIPVKNNKLLLRTGFSNLASAGFDFSKSTSTAFDGSKRSTTGQGANLSFGSSGFFNGLYVGISWLLK